MSYTYDQKHTTLIVEQDKTADGVTPVVLVQMDHPLGPSSAIHVQPEDAPVLALAVLEAAGISGGDISNTYLAATWNALDQYVKRVERERAERAEREAEDSQVAEFRKASDPGNHFEWHELKPEAHDAWRKRYRAARKFFEEDQS